AMLMITEAGSHWLVRQIIDDPAGHHDWVITATVDLTASDEAGRAVVTVTGVGDTPSNDDQGEYGRAPTPPNSPWSRWPTGRRPGGPPGRLALVQHHEVSRQPGAQRAVPDSVRAAGSRSGRECLPAEQSARADSSARRTEGTLVPVEGGEHERIPAPHDRVRPRLGQHAFHPGGVARPPRLDR